MTARGRCSSSRPARSPGRAPFSSGMTDRSRRCARCSSSRCLALPKGRGCVCSRCESKDAAARLAETGAAYLRQHGIEAEALAVHGTHPVDALLTEAAAMPARMLVMGAFEHSGLRTLFTGSATRKLLAAAPCPIFVAH